MIKLIFYILHPTAIQKQKNDAEETWPENESDYLPLRTSKEIFWTGFYASRSNYKGFVRETYSFLASAHQFLLFSDQFQKEEFDLGQGYALYFMHDICCI